MNRLGISGRIAERFREKPEVAEVEHIVLTPDASLDDLVRELEDAKRVAVDVITAGKSDAFEDVLGMTFATPERAYYVGLSSLFRFALRCALFGHVH